MSEIGGYSVNLSEEERGFLSQAIKTLREENPNKMVYQKIFYFDGQDVIMAPYTHHAKQYVRQVQERARQLYRKSISKSWIKTDDMQYLRKVSGDGYCSTFELIDAVGTDGRYVITRPAEVCLLDYIDPDGTPSPRMEGILKTYYNDPERFNYTNEDTRAQLMAEMIYETEAELASEYGFVTADQADEILRSYVEDGIMPEPEKNRA